LKGSTVETLVGADFFEHRWVTDELRWSPDESQFAIATFDTSARPSSVSAGAAYHTFIVYIVPSDGSERLKRWPMAGIQAGLRTATSLPSSVAGAKSTC
jgi:hypothetical protein